MKSRTASWHLWLWYSARTEPITWYPIRPKGLLTLERWMSDPNPEHHWWFRFSEDWFLTHRSCNLWLLSLGTVLSEREGLNPTTCTFSAHTHISTRQGAKSIFPITSIPFTSSIRQRYKVNFQPPTTLIKKTILLLTGNRLCTSTWINLMCQIRPDRFWHTN
jgi:hypothetical protein